MVRFHVGFFCIWTAACAVGTISDAPEGDGTDDAGTWQPSTSSSSHTNGKSDAAPTASSTADAAPTSTASTPDAGRDAPITITGGVCTSLFINEVRTDGSSASDEFVEIYNPGAECTFTGWKLIYRSAAGTSDVDMFGATLTIPAAGFVVIGGSSYSGTKQGSFSSGGLAAAGGQLALKNPGGTLVDSLGYGSASGAFVRGSAAPAPPASKSIGRMPTGTNTNNNSADFQVLTASTPGAAN